MLRYVGPVVCCQIVSSFFSHVFLFSSQTAATVVMVEPVTDLKLKVALPLFKSILSFTELLKTCTKHTHTHKQAQPHKQALFSHGICTYFTFQLGGESVRIHGSVHDRTSPALLQFFFFFISVHPVRLMRRQLQRHRLQSREEVESTGNQTCLPKTGAQPGRMQKMLL